MNSKKRGFCAIFGHFEVPRDGFNSNRIRIIAFISKQLAENFCCMVKVLHFLPNLKGQVVWSLPSDIWPGGSYSTPCSGIVMNVWGVTFGGYLAKILSFKSGNLLYK